MKPTLIVLCLLSCVTLIQGQFGWFDQGVSTATVDRSCTTEYDDIHCEKCDTKYHLACVKQSETVCRPTQVRLCNPEPIESCHFVKEDKCMHVPIPSCDVTWHKVCKDKLVCSKTFEVTVPHFSKFGVQDPPPPVYKEPVPTGGSGVPVGPIINNPDVSVEVTPQENVEVMVDDDDIINADDEIEPDDEIEGPEGPMINRQKRSLTALKFKKLGAKIGIAGISAAAVSGVIPGVTVDLTGGSNNRRRRSLDEDDEVEETEEYENLEEIETLPIPAGYSMPYESEEDHGERQKRGLPDFSWKKVKPVKNCVTQKKCTNVPKKDCGIHKKETCIPFPKKKCETKYIEKCYTVTRQECGEAVNKKCTSIPTKDCKKVIERRPRLVCPPPPTLERIQEPVFTKEVPIEGSGVPVGPIINN